MKTASRSAKRLEMSMNAAVVPVTSMTVRVSASSGDRFAAEAVDEVLGGWVLGAGGGNDLDDRGVAGVVGLGG